ncbi:DUF3040 domain-containing protein [Umezawaea sp. Da 62-37]|uniref:DUF3040 domain-containing protein n=1 Tax=Umezawaea sp. Da 62-37 TaxID=3075927 RepID=UPI0028F70D45|nr:DUF3040 domain-containing protein [Umezawaea sp. Da 62-37]WNV86202.1 DUF3040 domain-containing protein [Umezawaea sp. Da 62-37]
MALSDAEKRQLEAIEQELVLGDPKFAAKVGRFNSRAVWTTRLLRNVLILLGTYVVGLTVMICGVWLSSVAVIALGALVTASMPVLVGWRACREHWSKSPSAASRQGATWVR